MQLDIPTTPFVSTDWLAAHLQHPQLRIIDVRGQLQPRPGQPPAVLAERAAYAAGHIPAAVFVDWTCHILDEDEPIRDGIGSVEQLTALFGSLGIQANTLVVAYDNSFGAFAGLLRWVLRALGHDKARVLAGGYGKWLREGRPTTTRVPFVMPTAFTPGPRSRFEHERQRLLDALTNASAFLAAHTQLAPAAYGEDFPLRLN